MEKHMKTKRILAFLLTMVLTVSQLLGSQGLTVLAEGLNEGTGDGGNIGYECSHENKTTVNAKNATCTEDGYILHYICNDCNAYLVDEAGTVVVTDKATVTLKATDHNMTHHTKVDATCTNPGTKEYWACANCNKNFADEAGNNVLESE